MWVEHSKSQLQMAKVHQKGVLKSRIQFKFYGPNHILGIAESRIVKFLTQVGCIKCYQKDDISI